MHVLKKDSSQIGQNARKAVKFLDEATSNTDVKVFIQEPDDQYHTWAQVEAHYAEAKTTGPDAKENVVIAQEAAVQCDNHNSEEKLANGHDVKKTDTDNQLSQMITDKLIISKGGRTSPMSTPPLSPSSSGPQSTKTSPEVKSATIVANDLSPVPPSLKALINPVVWYTHEKTSALKNIILLTNSSDTAYLARDFGVVSKNIHQLRAAIGIEEQEAKNHDKFLQKQSSKTPNKPPSEPRTLFRYEDEESEEEEVVFKPRNRNSLKSSSHGRGGNSGSVRSRGHGHSPAHSLSGPLPSVPPKPQIPTEEIDPDSFDRGSFARGNTALMSVGNHSGNNAFGNPVRGGPNRGNHTTTSQPRGGNQRGTSRGFDRGSGRGRGRLFVP